MRRHLVGYKSSEARDTIWIVWDVSIRCSTGQDTDEGKSL